MMAMSEWRSCQACTLFYVCCVSADPEEAARAVDWEYMMHIVTKHPGQHDLLARACKVSIKVPDEQ